jgi:nitrite reductase (NO-forming)
MLDELPTYVVWNGRVGALNGKINTKVGDRVRMYVGNGGVAKVSSFHVIGEIFDKVYPEASISTPQHYHENIQSTLIPAGGATIVEFDMEVPGDYLIVDHSLARMDRGLWGVLSATGDPAPEIYRGGQ